MKTLKMTKAGRDRIRALAAQCDISMGAGGRDALIRSGGRRDPLRSDEGEGAGGGGRGRSSQCCRRQSRRRRSMTAIEVLLSAPGGGPQNVVVCRACEKSDPDLAALRKALALSFFHGVSRGAHVSERCEHPGHGQPAASC